MKRKKIVEYQIIYSAKPGAKAAKLDEVVNDVNEAMTQGWQPIGGIAVDMTGNFYQAVVLYEEEHEVEGLP